MSTDWTADVLAFHRKFGQHVGETVAFPPADVRDFRLKLIIEELSELLSAWARNDLNEIADGTIDLIYVLIGGLLAHGIDPRRVWAEVQRTNMAKEGGPTRADGKILKPPGWLPPDIERALAVSNLLGCAPSGAVTEGE